ncbi:MAG TPA: contractile injection system tape measure protein, partial [Saprospiraceae bacterium]|nr:contractile injection system tape measure protein [Saprospiraceae bacterium]
ITEGMALQQKMSSLCSAEIIPVIEKLLSPYTPLKGHVYIDRLEIDLGTFQSDALEYKLAEVFKEKLAALLSETSLQSAVHPGGIEINTSENQFRFTDEVSSFVTALIYFLRSGVLPWTFQLPEGKNLNEVLGEILKGPAREMVLYHLKESLHHPMVARRLALQFQETIVLDILQYVSPAMASNVEKLFHAFSYPPYLSFRAKILEAACCFSAEQNTISSQGDILFLAISLLQSDSKVTLQQEINTILETAQKHHLDTRPTDLEKAHARQDRSIMPRSAPALIPNETSGTYIDNAGLILLHPFLPALFEGTGITQENKIKDPFRALFLLHYLCTGQQEAPEYDLTFSKIICGIPVEDPVPSQAILPSEDIAEADALLSAAIRHWSILQNTSHDGLRGTFLLRRGKLTTAFDGGWLLQVERQSVDILLDHLPWGIGMVKLPWLPQLIHVEW